MECGEELVEGEEHECAEDEDTEDEAEAEE